MDDDLDTCSCDICAPIAADHALSTEEKFRQAWGAQRERPTDLWASASYWRGYAESLEAENYDLLQQVRELEQDLTAALARCPSCGRHK